MTSNVSRPHKRKHTRQELLSAAQRVFAARGFQASSIEDICQAASYTRGAFYSNFSTKDELFLALFDQHADEVIVRIRGLIDALAGKRDALDLFADRTSALPSAEREWFTLSTEFTLHAIRTDTVRASLAEHDQRVRAELASLIEAAFEAANRVALEEPAAIAATVIAVREGAMMQHFVDPSSWTSSQLRTCILSVLLSSSEPRPAADPSRTARVARSSQSAKRRTS